MQKSHTSLQKINDLLKPLETVQGFLAEYP